MAVNVATSREPLLHLAARLLIAAETDLENTDTLRSTAATLQLLISKISSTVIDAPTPELSEFMDPKAKAMSGRFERIDNHNCQAERTGPQHP